MKKFTLLLAILAIVVSGIAQNKPMFTSPVNSTKLLRKQAPYKGVEVIGTKTANPVATNRSVLDDPSLMVTKYDLQTNSSVQNRIYRYPDGTIGATATMSHNESFTDRGTGYNYYNGTNWGIPPPARIESSKAGWPSYVPLGTNGEIVVTHHNSLGLIVCTRPEKGTGAWTENILAGPTVAPDISWPRVVTNGPDRNVVHIICVTYVSYQGLDYALLYYRSLDGGQTWETQHRIIEGITQDEYLTIGGDTYSWAEPKGDTLCFVVGDSWNDLFIMKSYDNGDNWEKTVIWPCPYNKWEGGTAVDDFWCPDGSNAVALDSEGKAHVMTGLMTASGDEGGNKFWNSLSNGLLYWNENMPTWPEVLDPNVLEENGNVIGWVTDTNVLYVAPEKIAFYYVSLTSHPYLAIDEEDNIFAVWDGATMLEDVDGLLLRHIFGRGYHAAAGMWEDEIVDLTSDFIQYGWSECSYPSMSPTTSANKFHLVFQKDDLAGVYLNSINPPTGYQGQSTATDNAIVYLEPLKTVLVPVGIKDNKKEVAFDVSQNFPNPAGEHTSVAVNLKGNAALNLKITNIAGQEIMSVSKGTAGTGYHVFSLDCSSLDPGVYFYTVSADKQSITKKMVVK